MKLKTKTNHKPSSKSIHAEMTEFGHNYNTTTTRKRKLELRKIENTKNLSKKLTEPGFELRILSLINSQLHYQLSETSAFCALMSMSSDMFRLVKTYSVVPKDAAFI